ncbi:nucleotidyltransferase family protein [uncultured Tenacibaculum sp.]|uniref:nucleotidyltransferase domain-containing protein n=1 Tax=uncultured Tenacibaculum sp. TaxID=174713 RepID=UPI00260A9A0C|nr:nucleotidyltransferase family protein [uncultured Tenacibaculum sp.]
MTYKETLFFVGKCLTITHEEENRKAIEQKIIDKTVDWDSVVKLSTGHYVFPALYCNLKRAGFLHHLPNDLVGYMEHITNLNRERNQQIIEQAKEINELLLTNNITPIFLKGTGNLLDNLYDDIAERMLGDIDFLVSKNHFDTTIQVLKENGYYEKLKNSIDNTILNRHYPKMVKKDKIGAIEVHYKMITNEKNFNYHTVKQHLKKTTNNITVLSNEDQVLMTCFNKQLNDRSQWYKNVALRNSYDLYLLSEKTSIIKAISNLKNPIISNYLTNFVASTSLFFNTPKSLEYAKTTNTRKFIQKQLTLIDNAKKNKINKKLWNLYFLHKLRLTIILKSFYNKQYRNYVLATILKKIKPNS